MKIRYFPDTDTLWIELRDTQVAETRGLDETTLIDLDEAGAICSITIEHASERTDVSGVSFERMTTA
jgi:uncharacterized protein YuzE